VDSFGFRSSSFISCQRGGMISEDDAKRIGKSKTGMPFAAQGVRFGSTCTTRSCCVTSPECQLWPVCTVISASSSTILEATWDGLRQEANLKRSILYLLKKHIVALETEI
jgi:hypothetical protein